MKIKLLFTVLLLVSAGCSLFGSGARSTLEKYLSYAEEYNLDGMFGLMSDRLIKEMGTDKIRKDNEKFSDAVSKGNHKMQIISETVTGDSAKIVFFYKDAAKNDSVRLGFKFVKQSGDWKIDGYGFGDPDGDAPSDEEPDTTTPTPSNDNDPPPPEPATNKVTKPKR
jgi:hypothetical protein